jgi:hypothetical protein
MALHDALKRLESVSVLCFEEINTPRRCSTEEEVQWLRVEMSNPVRRYGTA